MVLCRSRRPYTMHILPPVCDNQRLVLLIFSIRQSEQLLFQGYNDFPHSDIMPALARLKCCFKFIKILKD